MARPRLAMGLGVVLSFTLKGLVTTSLIVIALLGL
jgi:hypothetical protein